MALQRRKPYLTPQEYLAQERQAETKSEYWRGEVYAMTGASRQHNLVVFNLAATLGPQLKRRPCEAYASDMRVKVARANLYTYPDVTVVCCKAEFEDLELDTLLNPTVIIEVLSPSTEAYDRSEKFGFYRGLESLSDYLLIAQSQPVIEHYTRQPDGAWRLATYQGLEAVAIIASSGCELRLADVYDKVEWPAAEARPPRLRMVKEAGEEYAIARRPGMA